MATPLEIKMAIAFHCSVEPSSMFSPEQWSSIAAKNAREWLRSCELITFDGKPTERLRVWIDHICETPLPVAEWKRGKGQ